VEANRVGDIIDEVAKPAENGRNFLSVGAWQAEGRRLFGDDMMRWVFVCPVCGHDQSPQDYWDAVAPSSAVAFSCVGRWIDGSREAFGGEGPGPCNYGGGGLFRLNPVSIVGSNNRWFAFRPPPSRPDIREPLG